ncbi:MAG: SPOR domain-containing protein [Bacteroidales bacterium]|nr:SPOR domain-containing protein [Bacteroidales bacterium]MBN2632754.1 SPOR domain-containing protein [Bacteroidales bacterium]
MDITPFIRELLFGHDCVIIPGFGGLIGNYIPARIERSSSTFYPPVKQISFNRNLNHNDGLLVGKISSALNLPYGDARSIADDFVAGIRRRLEKGEKVLFEKIGSFINNQEGNVQFEPDTGVNYHLNSFGLESFVFPPLEKYDVRKRITGHSGKDPVKRQAMRKILWRAAVVVPILALMVAVPLKTNLFRSNLEATTLNPLANAEFDSNMKAVENETPEIIINTEAADRPVTGGEDISETVAPVPEASFSYFIITGSFRQRENAEVQASLLEKEGFNPEIIDAPNGFFRVSAMRCESAEVATERRDSVSRHFPGAWVKKI